MIAIAFSCGTISALLGVALGWAISVKSSEDENGVITYTPKVRPTKSCDFDTEERSK